MIKDINEFIDNVAIHMREESKIIHYKLYEKYHIDIIL